MADTFTFFEKFGNACELLDDDDREKVVYAIGMYGMFGEEVELPYPLNVVFALMKEDIDNSKSARSRGSKGGRPKSKQEVSEREKPEVSEREKPEVSEIEKPEVSEREKPEVSDVSEKTESQTKPNQANTNQTNRESRAARFTPPTPEHVEEYASEKGYEIDAQRFCDFYASKGWMVGRSPMKDWKAAVRNWANRDKPKEADYGIYGTPF